MLQSLLRDEAPEPCQSATAGCAQAWAGTCPCSVTPRDHTGDEVCEAWPGSARLGHSCCSSHCSEMRRRSGQCAAPCLSSSACSYLLRWPPATAAPKLPSASQAACSPQAGLGGASKQMSCRGACAALAVQGALGGGRASPRAVLAPASRTPAGRARVWAAWQHQLSRSRHTRACTPRLQGSACRRSARSPGSPGS